MEDLSGKTIKGFELKARLGEGAYGAVYRASNRWRSGGNPSRNITTSGGRRGDL